MSDGSALTRFDHLVKAGVVAYDNQQEIVEHTEGNLKFRFVLTSALAKKPSLLASHQQTRPEAENQSRCRPGSDIDTNGYEIKRIGSTHVLTANKYSFARPHFLLLTCDGYQRQYSALNEDDFRAICTLLDEKESTEYIAFYNCGRDGGCSRLHKHVQLTPKLESSFARFLDDDHLEEPQVPFQWFYKRFEPSQATPEFLTKLYEGLRLQAVDAGAESHSQSTPAGGVPPHNMLLTKNWMIVLPRRRAAIDPEAGVNALGMLGYIAVSSRKVIDKWLEFGLVDALKAVGVPR